MRPIGAWARRWSGTAQPDTLCLDRATGVLTSCTIADKQVWLEPGVHETRPLPDEKRKAGCLNSKEVLDLWKLGLKVMDHFDAPQDIEWAVAGGQLYLLQSRAVTTLEDADTYERLLSDVRAQLHAAGSAGRGDWIRHNLGETLPHPTPLTWSVIRRFMSGSGGFGAMYKQVGFEPAPPVSKDGFLDLVAGRIYMDLSRAPEMFFEGFPYKYDLDLLRTNPDAAQGPPTVPSGSLLEKLCIARRLKSANTKLRELSRDFDRRLTGEIIPRFERYVADEMAVDLTALSTEQWCRLWQRRERDVLDDFAPQSLLPTLILAMAIEELRGFVREQFWDDDPDTLTNLLSATPGDTSGGSEPDLTVAANQGLCDVAERRVSVGDWLARFGHRAPEEFDLGSPRWREQPEFVTKMAMHMKGAAAPLARQEAMAQQVGRRIAELKASLSPGLRREFEQRLALVHRYIRFREDGKYYLMLGYDLLRDMLLDAARRLDIGDGVFLLSIKELHDALTTGIAPLHLIDKRRELRMAERRLSLPDVITEEDLAMLGDAPAADQAACLEALVLSSGTCTGPARIVLSPQQAGELGKVYVLVCPSTDPSWTPLFVNACGVVLERGGTLSHGAVVAREMGLPAAVLPGATRLLTEGETVTVDGRRGVVLRAVDAGQTAEAPEASSADPDDVRVAADRMPPVVGPAERRGAAVRNIFLAVWALFFLTFALAPGVVEGACYDLLDAALLPVVASMGKPATVALIAGLFAVLTVLGQKLLTDNGRLRVAKKRAATLRKEARKLPLDSPRRKALLALASPVPLRVTEAAFLPLAMLLGPMIVSFLWLPQRVNTAVRNAKPGSMVKITAVVDGDCDCAVQLATDEPLKLAESISKPQQRIFSARPPLEEHLRTLSGTQSDLAAMPWDQALPVKYYRRMYAEELQTFLAGRMPEQKLSWEVSTPKNKAANGP